MAGISKQEEEALLENQSSHRASQSSSAPEHNHIQKLHLVRRLDWRFLLPDPNLKRVVYIGETDPALVTALKYFASYLEILNSATPARKPFDFAVVRSRRVTEIQPALALLKAGGFLYWEVIPKNFFSLAHIAKKVEELATIGFDDIEAHWHRPSFERALDIIPLLDRIALDYFFSPERGDRRKSAVGRFLRRTGLLKYAMSSVSIVAVKSGKWK